MICTGNTEVKMSLQSTVFSSTDNR